MIDLCFARPEDVEVLAAVLNTAFLDDPVSSWLFPDRAERVRRQTAFFRIPILDALTRGTVCTTTGLDGAALWYDVESYQPAALDRATEHAYMRACGRYFSNFLTIYNLLRTNAPTEVPYAYLPFIGVRLGAQRDGIGTAMMLHELDLLDRARRPAYLECSNEDYIGFYERLGFKRTDRAIILPDGPTLYPMRREPQPL